MRTGASWTQISLALIQQLVLSPLEGLGQPLPSVSSACRGLSLFVGRSWQPVGHAAPELCALQPHSEGSSSPPREGRGSRGFVGWLGALPVSEALA